MPTCSRGALSAASWYGYVVACSAFARSFRSRSQRSPGPMARTPIPPASCPSPTATSTSSKAFSSTSYARSTTPGSRRCSRGCSAIASCGRRSAVRPARCRGPLPARSPPPPPGAPAPALTHIAAVRLERCVLPPRLDRDLLLSAAIVHDLGKTREFTYGAEISRSAQGRLLGHIELGLRLLAEHVPATLGAERRLALEHCMILHHGADAAAGQRFGSPEALALYRLNALDAQGKSAVGQGGPR